MGDCLSTKSSLNQLKPLKPDCTKEEYFRLLTVDGWLDQCLSKPWRCDTLIRACPLEWELGSKKYARELKRATQVASSLEQSRAVACLMGNILGDSLGAPVEFTAVRPSAKNVSERLIIEPFGTLAANNDSLRFRLRPGQWTDDGAMALCLADFLLFETDVGSADAWKRLRIRFSLWWDYGLCSSLRLDIVEHELVHSFGLGGTVGASFSEFEFNRCQHKFTVAGNKASSGNGSLMRNGAVPCFARRDPQLAMRLAAEQSRTTHQGVEAAECCRLLTWLCCRAIRRDQETGDKSSESRKARRQCRQRWIAAEAARFETDLYAVRVLAESGAEQAHADNAHFDLADRRWVWRVPQYQYKYCESRAAKQPTYFGSYAMDGLCLALHCFWATDSFVDCLLYCANFGGDADTTTAIVGQLAGAYYGMEAVPPEWVAAVERHAGNGELRARANLLFRKGAKFGQRLATAANSKPNASTRKHAASKRPKRRKQK